MVGGIFNAASGILKGEGGMILIDAWFMIDENLSGLKKKRAWKILPIFVVWEGHY